ncbi:MAG: PaaI family thioesterase [Actinobacteria bacterium]|nr:PaaI family thioesterase [Actinomycetota bacterium]
MLMETGAAALPGHMGLEILEIEDRRATLRLEIGPHHLAPNGYLHAGAVITLADTAAGYGCIGNLPEGGTGFTTLEMKANFLGTLLEGSLLADAELSHGGRTTQIWDVPVTDEASGRRLALFRCTQLILYPRS